MKKTGRIILTFSILFFSLASLAAQYKVEASVDRDQMGIGDSFTLNIRITGDEDFNIDEPKVPRVDGLELLNAWAGGRQSSSRMSIVNGQTQFSKSISQDYNYQFSPQKEGVFSIPVIDVTINGQNFRTNPIKIEVAEQLRNSGGSRQQKPPRGRPQFPPGFGDDEPNPFGQGLDEEEDLFSQLMKQRQRMFGQLPNQGRGFGGGGNQPIPQKKMDINMKDAFFVHLDLDKTEVYEGEQITANWYIYTKGSLESLDRVKFPDLRGFWKEIIEEVPSLQFSPEIVNGVLYNKALLASHALFPIKAGNAVIDEFKVKGRVRTQGAFGWGQSAEFTKVSKRQNLKVLPLPLDGRPSHFSGAVGIYRVSLKVDGNTFPVNQPFSIKLRFEGVGNAKLIDLPNISWPEGLEIFDTKNESRFFKDGQSFKEFEVLVIPRRDGDLKIPEIQFSYFDPKQKKYVSQMTEAISLKIVPGQGQSTGPMSVTSSPSPKSNVETEFKALPILELPQGSFVFMEHRTAIYSGVAALMAFILTMQFAWEFRNLKFDPGLRKTIETKLKFIEQAQDPTLRGSEAVNLIYLLAAFLAGQNRANQEWQTLVKEIPLKSQGLYLDRLTQLFDYFQILGFSPESVKASLLGQYPVEEKIKDLKKITEEISLQIKAEEKA